MSKPKTHFYWHVRTYEGTQYVRLLLCRQFGKAGHECYTWGLVHETIAEEIIAAVPLPVVRDAMPYSDDGKGQPKELTPTAVQGSLFS